MGDVSVKRIGVGWPAPPSPPAYHLPSWGWPILRHHQEMCDDCEHIFIEAHVCPACDCADDYWSHCDSYRRLYRESVVPTLAADGHHMSEREVWRGIHDRMMRGMAQAFRARLVDEERADG